MKALTTGFNPTYYEDAPNLEDIKDLDGYAVLEFGAPWCGHCRAAAPAIEKVLSQTEMPHIKIFDGKGKRLGRHFGVRLWPTLILLKSGQEMERVVRPTEPHPIETLLALAQ
ncbi:MAG: thioredoxin family protein [Cellvibrionaceae bacterium]